MANGLVDYHIETPDKIKSIFEGAGISTPSYNKLKLNNQQSIDTFKKAIAKAKQSLGNDGASVELKDDYTDINLYLSEDGESGFGIKPNGDIVSVFSSKKVKGREHHMLEMAVYEGGGRQLDCFDIYLTKIYETHGFKPVAKMKWDDEYIPEGWNKDNFKDYNNGEPDVVFMVYDPNNDIEKKHKDRKIPYITDYDDGDKIQQKYFEEKEKAKNKNKSKDKENKKKENNKITIKNKSRDGLDKTEDKINNFLKGNANKLKEEVKEETQADAKKEFKESDVNRDEDGKFAEKPSSNKSKDNDKIKDNDNDIEITDNDRILFMHNLDEMIHGFDINNDINDISENRIELIKSGIASGRFGTIEDIDKEVRYNKALEKSDKDKYNKYKEYKETAEYKEKMKKAINQFEGDTKATAEKLYSENLKGGSLISDDKYKHHFELDEEKFKKLNPIEKAINYFTESYKNRNKQGFKNYQREIKSLINKSMPKEISLYRYETEEDGKKRYNLKVGDTINMAVRSFCNSENAFDSCRALQLRNRQPNECVIYKVDGAVKSLEIQSLSKFINQQEHIVDGDFEITEIREATNLMPKIITIKQKGVRL